MVRFFLKLRRRASCHFIKRERVQECEERDPTNPVIYKTHDNDYRTWPRGANRQPETKVLWQSTLGAGPGLEIRNTCPQRLKHTGIPKFPYFPNYQNNKWLQSLTHVLGCISKITVTWIPFKIIVQVKLCANFDSDWKKFRKKSWCTRIPAFVINSIL